MKFITKTSIQTVIDDASVYDVVSHFEQVEKKGSQYFCKSPFSTDKTASLAIHPTRNFWKCFSSGLGGSAVTFVMKKKNCTFIEAIVTVAEISGIVLQYEERSEDQKRFDDELDSLKKVVEYANEKYLRQFNNLPNNHWLKKMIAERGYSDDVLGAFSIGYAPDSRDFVTTPLINNGNFENAKSVGLTNTKENSSYDFFRDRWMFPIHNEYGLVVAFGGRRSNDEDVLKMAKYLNSKESKIYNKSKILYGLYQAKKSINVTGYAILTEGYTDVMSCHQAGVTNTIATCGTALTEDQVKILAKLCKHVVIFRDGDQAGIKAVIRDIDVLLRFGFKVDIVIAEDGEDPDSLSRKTDLEAYINNNKKDAITWKAKELYEQSKLDDYDQLVQALQDAYNIEAGKIYEDLTPDEIIKEASPTEKKIYKAKNDSVHQKVDELKKQLKKDIEEIPVIDATKIAQNTESIAHSLSLIANEIKLKEYTKTVAKIMKQPLKTLETIIIVKKEEAVKKAKAEKEEDPNSKLITNLPKGSDLEQYLKDRFCEIGEVYHFQNKSGDFFIGTNHIVTPLFHIDGRQNNKRLCEVKNIYGAKRLIDFDSTDIINFTKFKERLIREGNFFWEPGATNENFLLVSRKLSNEFITASELITLGQQEEGFFAFSNGVYHDNQFLPVNKYGIVHVDGLTKHNSEYKNDVCHYYSPSHSETYKWSRDGDDPYENDRYFTYKESPVRLDQWFNQLVKVFGIKGKLGAAFIISSCFRDLFLHHWKFFPLMGGFGQRDSGKSGFGNCIQSVFFTNLPGFELSSSTLSSMGKRLSRVKNAIVFFDEYRDDIDEEKHQALKGAWNGLGREKSKGVDSNRTTVDKVNSAIYYAGQYLPTKDDGALPSRTIILNFGQEERTVEQKEEYNKLMNWNKAGISSLVLDIIKYRKYFSENIINAYKECIVELKNGLKGTDYQNRIFENYLVLLSTVKVLESRITLPFTYQEFFELTKDCIIENSDTISDSDGLANFWRIVYSLNEHGKICENSLYSISRDATVEITVKKQKTVWKNTNKDQILYLRFKDVHHLYHKEVSTMKDEEVIKQTTILNYLKSKKYFLGPVQSKRVDPNVSTSCYAFNYSEMLRLNIVSLRCDNDSQLEIEELEAPF